LVGLALLCVGAAPAGASDLAPNPSFETDCAGVPCGWAAASNATVTRDTTASHSGGASLRMAITDPSLGSEAVGCATGVVPGSYIASMWYLTANPGSSEAGVILYFYSSSTCSGAPLSSIGDFDTGYPAWHRLEVAAVAPAGTQSVGIRLHHNCSGCAVGTAVNWDDVAFVSSLAPNPSFESDCAGVPCGWSPNSNATLARDTTVSHNTGAASLRMTAISPSSASEALSCATGVSAGNYLASGWYRTAATVRVDLWIYFYPTTNCTGSPLASFIVNQTGNNDSVWHRLEAAGVAPAGSQSARVSVISYCGITACLAGTVVNYDDVALVADLAPNPSFDTDCAGVPCGWSPNSNATLARDASLSQGGQFSGVSLRMTTIDGSVGSEAIGCATGVLPGSYLASSWYRTTAVAGVQLLIYFYSTSNCTGSPLANFFTGETTAGDTSWHRLEAASVAPPGTQSAGVRLGSYCGLTGCASGTTVNYDDVALGGGQPGAPTAAKLLSFRARRAGRPVVLSWRTASEVGVLGYELLRNGQLVNAHPIPATGHAGGATYRFVDRAARPGRAYVYRIETVDLGGGRHFLGTARVSRR
jgi:hypothetical protein